MTQGYDPQDFSDDADCVVNSLHQEYIDAQRRFLARGGRVVLVTGSTTEFEQIMTKRGFEAVGPATYSIEHRGWLMAFLPKEAPSG